MFDYNNAFSRNIGWVTEEEQDKLKHACIGIIGCGGVGFEHGVTLARLGIEQFHISDFDDFEEHNMNRQAGCFQSTLGQAKCDVLERTIKDINPDATVESYGKGIDESNVDAFLENIDVYVDSLDFFALEARILVFERCQQKRIPVITAAPMGMGVAFLCFRPGKMTFEEYFGFNTVNDRKHKLLKFIIGLSPAVLQRSYLVDESRADFNQEKGPSTGVAVKLCAGVIGTSVLKLVLNRGDVITAPHGLHFDAYKNKMVKTWLPFGHRGLMQRFKFKLAKRILIDKPD